MGRKRFWLIYTFVAMFALCAVYASSMSLKTIPFSLSDSTMARLVGGWYPNATCITPNKCPGPTGCTNQEYGSVKRTETGATYWRACQYYNGQQCEATGTIATCYIQSYNVPACQGESIGSWTQYYQTSCNSQSL